MGYISSVQDARLRLEKVFKLNQETQLYYIPFNLYKGYCTHIYTTCQVFKICYNIIMKKIKTLCLEKSQNTT